MAYAYVVTNQLAGLAVGNFVWSAGANDATRARLNDARMSSRYVNGSPVNSISVIVDLGSAKSLCGWGVLNSNVATQFATALSITSASDAAITTDTTLHWNEVALNSSAPHNKDHAAQFAADTARRYWQLEWVWTGTCSSFAIGELWAWTAPTQLTRSAIYGHGQTEEILSAKVDFDNGGTRSSFKGGPLRSLRLPFADLSLSERRELATMWRATRGPVAPFLFLEKYAAAVSTDTAEQACVYGKLELPAFSWSEPDFNLFEPTELLVRSLGREVGA